VAFVAGVPFPEFSSSTSPPLYTPATQAIIAPNRKHKIETCIAKSFQIHSNYDGKEG